MTTVAENDPDHATSRSVPLIPLARRRNYSPLDNDHLDDFERVETSYDGGGGGGGGDGSYTNTTATAYYNNNNNNNTNTNTNPFSDHDHDNMARLGRQEILATLKARKGGSSKKAPFSVISSYVFDWIIIFAILGMAAFLNHKAPNRRPFSLEDPNISFPFTEHETVPAWLLVTLNCGVPVVLILLISLLLVPGHTVPRGTPASLVWKRKLWELHVGWLGLALALSSVWLITNGMKNLFGKPRPDALARCNPDLANWTDFVVGGENVGGHGGYNRLVSAAICQGMADHEDAQDLLEDGFRSYPSGHASSAAAGLIYLSLFIASKFAITFPFLAPGNNALTPTSFSAFPSRNRNPNGQQAQRLQQQQQQQSSLPLPHSPLYHQTSTSTNNNNNNNNNLDEFSPYPAAATTTPTTPTTNLFTAHNASLSSARRQAAAPPLYLLLFATAPFFTAIFIAASRWYDFRHHGFDILFGFLMGTVCAFFSFRWYHLPVSQGAGWAWGPRCADKAWWAGVGSFSYAMDWEDDLDRAAGSGGLRRDDGGGGRHFHHASAMEEGRRGDKLVGVAGSGHNAGDGADVAMGLDGERETRRRAL